MDAFGYKLEEDGKIWFSWVFINVEKETLWLNGILGEVAGKFIKLGPNYREENFDTKTIPLLKGLGYVFDFNDKCQELLLRFPLININNISDFRFERVEPLLHSALQRSGNGFCDYGYCDEEYLYMVPWVYSPEMAIKTFSIYLPKILKENELDFSVWTSEKGSAQKRIWPLDDE